MSDSAAVIAAGQGAVRMSDTARLELDDVPDPGRNISRGDRESDARGLTTKHH